ncbi:MAG: alkaline phosphatase family protein, partial [Candidatus Neomarinimicrobiota bacterium]|nr:alkaline phosphatase family protein [Candidatus Neomarinimicrobiota bacterium]
KILEWIDLPKQSRPVFMTLYFSDVDSWGHNIGPDAIGMNSIIEEIDESIGLLVSGLNKREILDNINIIITSDHGMAGLSRDRVIFLDDYININDVRMVDWSPVAMILPEDDSIVSTYSALYDAHPQMSVFKKEDVPARLHFNNHRRIPPIICIAADGWSISDRDYFDENPYSFTGGTHGYEPINKSMHGIFIASGPGLKEGLTIDSFSSIHIYEVIAHILDIDTPENDASFDSISVMLK